MISSRRGRVYFFFTNLIIGLHDKKLQKRLLKAHSKAWDIFGKRSLLKIMKNAFYFTLKGLFVLKIFKFLSWIFGQVEKTAWEINNCNTHTIQYLKKCNQVMKFGQFRRYNMRNIFLEKSHKTWRRNFCQTLKNQNWAYPRINNLEFYTVCFCCNPSWGRSLYIETKLETTCFDLI